MNSRYFACMDCRIYLDAGYRWCRCELEMTGVVTANASVDVDAVLANETYWNPPHDPNSKWLSEELLPSVRSFLRHHRAHHIVFLERDDLPQSHRLDWMQVGYCLSPTPRYFVEELNLRDWDEVLAWDRAQGEGRAEFWMLNDRELEQFRRTFERLRREHSTPT